MSDAWQTAAVVLIGLAALAHLCRLALRRLRAGRATGSGSACGACARCPGALRPPAGSCDALRAATLPPAEGISTPRSRPTRVIPQTQEDSDAS